MKGILLYLLKTNKLLLKVHAIKNIAIALVICIMMVIGKNNLWFDAETANLITIFSLIIILIFNSLFFFTNYSRICRVKFDLFVATTGVSYAVFYNTITGLHFLVNGFNYTISIMVIYVVNRLIYHTDSAEIMILFLVGFLIYAIWSLLLIPLTVYFRDYKIAMLSIIVLTTCISMVFAKLEIPTLSLAILLNPIILSVIVIILYFISWQLSKAIWRGLL